jgi:signal transduction histidine kinase
VRTKTNRTWQERLLVSLPFAIAVCGLAATLVLSDVLVRRDLAQLQARTEAEAKHVASQVRVGTLQAFDPLRRIGAWWLSQGRPLAPEDWDADARLFVRSLAGLELVTWTDARGESSWSVQPGVDTDPHALELPRADLKVALEAARRLNSFGVSRVFEIGGQPKLYACTPVFREGKVAGFIAGRYDVTGLIRAVLEGQLPNDYSVVVTANGREIPAVASSARVTWSGIARDERIEVANSYWSVRVVSSGSEVATLRRLVISFGVLVSILLYACAAMALVARRRATELADVNSLLLVENQERSRAEERIGELNRDLQRRLEEFRILLEVLPVGIAIAEDPACRNIWANRSMAGMLQVPVGRNISKSAQEADRQTYQFLQNGHEVPADDLPMQVAARTRAAVANQELDIVRSDGSTIHTLSYSAPVFDENGNVRGVIDACVDITDRKRAEEERQSFLARRRELEQRVERGEKYHSLALMAGGIAHDFNNLLTVIIGHANVLATDLPKFSDIGRSAADILAAANRAAELTSKLVAFTGHIWCDARPVNLSAEVFAMQPAMREMVPPATELRFDLCPDLPVVHAGISELQQVIHNLLENAAESLDGHPGIIEIRTSQCELSAGDLGILFPDQPLAAGRYVRLEVTDNGCGIPEEISGRIFDPFFTTKFVGRGLGLSAVQGIVRAHSGAIRVESSMHHGTRVEVVLPVEHSLEFKGLGDVYARPLLS